jgi:antitoxin component YwqK of YwqJK toxin-antitoxin module
MVLYIFDNELVYLQKYEDGKRHGEALWLIYGEGGVGYALLIRIYKNGKIVKRMKPRVIID